MTHRLARVLSILRRASVLTLASFTLAGCMPAHRQAPVLAQITVPDHWATPYRGVGDRTEIDPRWWQSFGDASLDRYVEAALNRNTDLLVAGSRLDAARAQVQLARSALGPTLAATTGVNVESALGAAGANSISRAVQPSLQASWELDLWGRLRAQASAAQLQYRASESDRDAVALSISAATVESYIGLLALESQLRQTQETAASRAEALRIARDKASVGYTSQLQLTQAESEYQAVLQSLPQLNTSIARQYNALLLLTGEIPDTRRVSPPAERLAGLRLPQVPIVLPSELLRRRPDLAQAEQLLAASDASLAASRAAFLPQVSLSASLGALYVNALNYDPTRVWSIGGSILAPLFDRGRLAAQHDSAAAQRDQAAFGYRGAVLRAFGDVENALVGVANLESQLDHAAQRRSSLLRSVDYAKDRYEAGYAPYLDQLDAQRNLYQSQIELINIRQTQLLNRLALFKAMGGGWRPHD